MNFSIKPSEKDLRKAKPIVESSIKTCNSVLHKENPIEVVLTWSETFESNSISSEKIEVAFNTSSNEWDEKLNSTVARGYAQTWFLEYKEIMFQWENLIHLGHSLVFAENITDYKPDVDDKNLLKQNWSLVKEELGNETHDISDTLRQFGFSYAYYIAKELSKEHSLENFPELNKSSVIQAGDKAFS